jgi:hypothetical protein
MTPCAGTLWNMACGFISEISTGSDYRNAFKKEHNYFLVMVMMM